MRRMWLAGAALVAGLSMGASAHAQTSEGADAGDRTADAGRLAADRTLRGEISPGGDLDLYRIRLEAGRVYRITLAGAGDAPLADPVLAILTGDDEEPLAQNDDSDGALNSALSFTPIATGDYYVAARAFSGEDTGGYDLRVERGERVSAAARPLIAPGQTLDGTIAAAGERDFFRARLNAGEVYRVTLTRVEGENGLPDPYVRLYPPGALRAAFEDDDSGGDLNSYLEVAPDVSGEYLLEAAAFADGGQGAYRIALRAGDIPAGVETDVLLNPAGDHRFDRLHPAGDKDWYRLDLAEGATVRLRLANAEGEHGGLADPMLVVYGPDGAELARNDDSGGDLNSYLEFTAPSAGPFFVEAGGFQDDAAGAYGLSLQPGEIPADATSDETLAPHIARTSLINAPGDSDWFAIHTVEGRTYRIHAEGGGDGAIADPVLTLYAPVEAEPSGAVIDEHHDHDHHGDHEEYVPPAYSAVASDDDGGSGANAYLTFTAPRSATYFAAVSAFADQHTGGYSIRFVDSEVPRGTDTDEMLAGEDDARESRIDFAGDEDAFRAVVEPGARYVARVEPSGESDALANPALTVRDEGFAEIGANDDESRRSRAAQVTFTAPADQSSVYLIVRGAGLGLYQVKIARAD